MKEEECNTCPKHTCESNANIVFDSEGEEQFYQYCSVLKETGYIDNYGYQPDPFKLSDKIEYIWINKTKTKEIITSAVLLNPHEYTCDFLIKWNHKAHNIFYLNIDDKIKLNKIPFIAKNNISYIECKPAWDQNNMTRLAKINIKWVYEKYGVYIQIITPSSNKSNCLFAETFIPEKCLLTKKTKKPKVFKYPVRSLNEFVDETKKLKGI